MYQTLTTSDAVHKLLADDNATWTYDGATALIEHLEQYEEVTKEGMEFDRVAIRCEWSEYESLGEALEQYGKGINSVEDLADHTDVIMTETGVVIVRDF